MSGSRPIPLRYLPHQPSAEVLRMGLSRLAPGEWIETDAQLGDYHRHKLQQRKSRGDAVYRATPESLPAQREFASLLEQHLLQEHRQHYRIQDGQLHCDSGSFVAPMSGEEPLWLASLWIADDVVIMQAQGDAYVLTAASLCSPSHWHLSEKFRRPLREIHDPIPGFHQRLTPGIDRFFTRLQPGPPFVRCNWSLQAGDGLAQFPGEDEIAVAGTPLYYRVERQSLKRLPETDAIAFTIRVYLHPLEELQAHAGALPALLQAIDDMPPALAHYKGLDRLAPALGRYRALAESTGEV